MNNEEETPQEQHTTFFPWLATVSFLLYFIALFIPAIGDYQGISILIAGFVFCWFIPSTLAFFANLFYFYIFLRYLTAGRCKANPVFAATYLMILTLFTPLADAGNWRWGAFFWGAANFLLAADVFLKHKCLSAKYEITITVGILSIFLLPAIYLNTT